MGGCSRPSLRPRMPPMRVSWTDCEHPNPVDRSGVTNDSRPVSLCRIKEKGGDMASKTRIPKAKITGIYGGLLKMMARKMLGAVPEGAEVMWHYPAVLKDMMG